MHLLYVDESGGPDGEADKQHFVLGGVSVFEKRPYFLTGEFDKLCAQLVPSAPNVELHASPIFNGNGEPWASMPRDKRMALLDTIYQFIANQNITLFGVVMHKTSFTAGNAVQRTCEELAGHFDAYLGRLSVEWADKQLGLIIFDESHRQVTVHNLLQEFRTTGLRFGRIKHLAEAPLFAESKLTRVLQIADFVAYAIFRRYERGDSRYLDMLIRKFDQADGCIHGLVHLVADYRNCFCPACATRR